MVSACKDEPANHIFGQPRFIRHQEIRAGDAMTDKIKGLKAGDRVMTADGSGQIVGFTTHLAHNSWERKPDQCLLVRLDGKPGGVLTLNTYNFSQVRRLEEK